MTGSREFDNGRRRALQVAFGVAAAAALPRTASAQTGAGAPPEAFARLRDKHVSIGMLIFPRIDQIDFTGPFEVLVRIPETIVHVIGTEAGPFRDHKGLLLTPDVTLADAPAVDLLVIPGGPGQEALMQVEPVLSFIRSHVNDGKPLFSVCTGALICGAAGILKDRRATTHWAAFHLLPYFGAVPVSERVVVDGNLVTAAGVTAGLDGAFSVAALLRGNEVAQDIQLDIQYAPEPPFDAGTPETAPRQILERVQTRFQPLTAARLETAKVVAGKLATGL